VKVILEGNPHRTEAETQEDSEFCKTPLRNNRTFINLLNEVYKPRSLRRHRVCTCVRKVGTTYGRSNISSNSQCIHAKQTPPTTIPDINKTPNRRNNVLLVYDKRKTYKNKTLAIKSIIEKESFNPKDFLDLSMNCSERGQTYNIQKAHSEAILHNDCCHPHEHKEASIHCLLNRSNKNPISKETKKKRNEHYGDNLRNNKYNMNSRKYPTPQQQNRRRPSTPENEMVLRFIYWKRNKESHRIIQE
jgi:hypothetical protein